MARQPLIEIDLSTVSSSQELHAALAKCLHFPEWYGANWDAFWDAITGLVEMPISLHLIGWNEVSRRLPREAKLLQACLQEMSAEHPELASKVNYA
ncbi:MAG: barstar family protein [Aquabacterium sp.]|uniref:barstar family protein n=1 Tax=Aquabacterium sp. TaxID=1872578 RepID=UPI002728136C|nr:barstar family protein [Aquabacterium sp.]MDO9003120.1 barstar family protein [Aquabacterium sp.]